MTAQLVRRLIGGALVFVGVVALMSDGLPEHQAIGLMFFGIAIAIWPTMSGKKKE